jgi:catechol 2,3-dioxygenase
MSPANPDAAAETPSGLNHLVLNVRDFDAAHRFWTECLGFRHVGTSRFGSADGSARPRMRFYSGETDGKLSHHHLALMEAEALPPGAGRRPQTLNHIAITYPSPAAWRRQIGFLLASGVALHGRVDRGAASSVNLFDPDGNEIELVCERPREEWEHDIDAALNTRVERRIDP